MQSLVLILTVIAYAAGDAPYPASGDRPQGALLVHPLEYGPPSGSGPSFQSSEIDDLSKVSDKVMNRLRQEAGSNSGSYHVYLADGRLQKVQYTTAPFQSGQGNRHTQAYTNSQQYSDQYNQGSSGNQLQQQGFQQYSQNGDFSSVQYYQQQQNGRYNQNGQYRQQDNEENSGLNPVIARFGRIQQDFQQQQIQQLQQKQQQLEQQQQELRQQQEQLKSANYVASLQFSNVDPITSPIYSYKPSSVTRILRYAPQYF